MYVGGIEPPRNKNDLKDMNKAFLAIWKRAVEEMKDIFPNPKALLMPESMPNIPSYGKSDLLLRLN